MHKYTSFPKSLFLLAPHLPLWGHQKWGGGGRPHSHRIRGQSSYLKCLSTDCCESDSCSFLWYRFHWMLKVNVFFCETKIRMFSIKRAICGTEFNILKKQLSRSKAKETSGWRKGSVIYSCNIYTRHTFKNSPRKWHVTWCCEFKDAVYQLRKGFLYFYFH